MATSSEGEPPEVIPSGEVPSVPEVPKRRPWGKIAAIVIAIVVIVAVLAIVLQPRNRPPTITQATPSAEAVDVGASITFTAQASDPDGNALTYTWNFGDGTANGTGASVTHAYSLPGRFIALLTVDDGHGGVVTNDGKLIFIQVKMKGTDVGQPKSDPSTGCAGAGCTTGPAVSVLGADQNVITTGTTVKFNANASWAYTFAWKNVTNHSESGIYSVVIATDHDTLFSQFAYAWGDGTAQVTGTSDTVGQTTHTFSSTGLFFVKLTGTLTTNTGTATVSAGYTVRVTAAAPVAQVKYPDIYTIATFGEPQYLDPATDYETAGGEVIQNVYETLIWYNQGTPDIVNLTPRLATAVPSVANGLISPDGKNYTFNLLQNVTFHDGSHMTAADVVYSIQRVMAILNPGSPSWIIEQYLSNYVAESADAGTIGDWVNGSFTTRADVPATMRTVMPPIAQWDTTPLTTSLAWAISNSSVSAPSTYQVVFHLTHPYAAFLQTFAFTVASVVSKSCVEANGGVHWGMDNDKMDRGTADCGTGPFKIKAWEPNQVIILTRFDQYWRTPATLKEVHIAKVQDTSTRELMLLAGDADSSVIGVDHQYDVINTDGTSKYPTLRIVRGALSINIDFMGYQQKINVAKAPDPWVESPTFFADLHIRKAFSWAFDYATYINKVLYGNAIQPGGAIPKGLFGYNASIPLFSKNLANAAAELKLAINTTTGQSYFAKGFSITLYYNAGNTQRETAALLLKQGLEAIPGAGPIKVTTRGIDWPVYLAAQTARALPAYFLGWAPDYADPDDYVVPFLYSGPGGYFAPRIHYSNTTLDAMMTAASKETDPAKRLKMYQDLTADSSIYDVPILWLDQQTGFHVERTWVKGWYANPMLSGFDYYTMSKA